MIGPFQILITESYRLHWSGTAGEVYSQYESGRRHTGRLFVRTAIFYGACAGCR